MNQTYPDFLGKLRSESTATGAALPTLRFCPSLLVRRKGRSISDWFVLELAWWDGARWLYLDSVDEMSNDYAYTYIAHLAQSMLPDVKAFEQCKGLPPPPRIL